MLLDIRHSLYASFRVYHDCLMSIGFTGHSVKLVIMYVNWRILRICNYSREIFDLVLVRPHV